MISPCVMSGHCCLTAPCLYGEAGDDGICIYLDQPNDIGQRACLKHDEIIAVEKSEPERLRMMGTGCSSTLFNELRNSVINELNREKSNVRNNNK
tara:strand:+ start:148 stop:432 length:285 start_codon:yes stop_codon:yes gene_type:complete